MRTESAVVVETPPVLGWADLPWVLVALVVLLVVILSNLRMGGDVHTD